MRTHSRYEDADHGIAWPGLVDLFAFGMILMFLLWAEARLRRPDPVARAPIEIVEEQAANVSSLVEADAIGAGLNVKRSEGRTLKLEVFGSRQIFFKTGVFDLPPEDVVAVRAAADVLSRVSQSHPSLVFVVNGTADPRKVNSLRPPRDNVELSALRAAAVAKILTDVGLGDRTRVQGLGETGDLEAAIRNAGGAENRLDEELGRYRQVTIEIHVDTARLNAEDKRTTMK